MRGTNSAAELNILDSKGQIEQIQKLTQELSFYKNAYNLHYQKIQIIRRGIKEFIVCKDIIMIEASSNYSIFYLTDGTQIVTSKTLKYWEEIVPHELFVRCHHSYIINKFHVLSFKFDSKVLRLNNDSKVKVSKKYETNLSAILTSYYRKNEKSTL